MEIRAVARLVVVSVMAFGVLAISYYLAHEAPATAAASAYPLAPAPGTGAAGATPTPRPTDARNNLQQALVRPAAVGQPAVPGATSPRVVRVDESQPHVDVFDPQTGGLISVAPAVGTLPKAKDLGPMHADPMPPGVRLSDPTDTASLLERAGEVQAALADADQPVAAGASAPIGTPSVDSLSAHVAPSCSGTGTDGKRVQVLYVHESSKASRYSAVLPLLRNEVANVDDVFAVSSAQTGGGRRVRWVHDSGCFPVISDVTVPDGALGSDFWGTVTALKNLGYKDPNRKYLVFADANQFCGIGTLYSDTKLTGNLNDGYAASFARVDANCWSTGHSVAAHELTHNLGGVQQSAPHSTVNGHCWDESDIMCYDDGSGVAMKQVCAASQEELLDCNHDDYFNTNPAPGSYLATSWNTASSGFLDTVPALGAPPGVAVSASTSAAKTGDPVTFTATSPRSVTWRWATASGCSLTPGAAGAATLVCPATSTGTVTVTASATDASSGAVGSASASISVSRAAAPTVQAGAPAAGSVGASFPVSATATGTAPFGYAWTAGSCSVTDPTAASTTVTCPVGTASQMLAVTVAATQRDGQTGQGTAYVAVTGAGPAPTPAAVAWTAPSVGRGLLHATLRTSSGAALAAVPVVPQVRWYGTSTWVDLPGLVTDSSGIAVTGARYPTAGTFRFSFAGDASHGGALSAEVYLKVSTKVAAASSRHRVAATLATVSGQRLAGARLTLQRRVAGTSRWVRVATVRTNYRGAVVERVRPPHRSYFRWVFRGEVVHHSALSARLTVRR